MRLFPFRRRSQESDLPTHNHSETSSQLNHHQQTHKQRLDKSVSRPRRSREPCPYGPRPSFTLWWKLYWEDVAFLIVLGIIGAVLMGLSPRTNRYVAITFANGEIVYPEMAYPKLPTTVPLAADAVVAIIGPIFIFLLLQIRIRCFWTFNNSVLGTFYSVLTAAVFQLICKVSIGGLRPNFLQICQPDVSKLGDPSVAKGYQSIYFLAEDICTNPDRVAISNAMQSFPSGHSTAAWAGLLYLTLNLNAQLKVIFTNVHASYWKLAAIVVPPLGATLICGQMQVTANHHWYDVVAGGIIGSVMAVISYRNVFAAITDFRINHIPLPPRRLDSWYGITGGTHSLYRFNYTVEEALEWRRFTFSTAGGFGSDIDGEVKGAPGDLWRADLMSSLGSQREYGVSRKPVPISASGVENERASSRDGAIV